MALLLTNAKLLTMIVQVPKFSSVPSIGEECWLNSIQIPRYVQGQLCMFLFAILADTKRSFHSSFSADRKTRAGDVHISGGHLLPSSKFTDILDIFPFPILRSFCGRCQECGFWLPPIMTLSTGSI